MGWRKDYFGENGLPRDMTRAEVIDALAARDKWNREHGVVNQEAIRQQRPPTPSASRQECAHCGEDMPSETYAVHLAIRHTGTTPT